MIYYSYYSLVNIVAYMHKNVLNVLMFFCIVTPCGLVGRHQRFEETYCLHLQG
jgi:hypothetical protein